MRISDWSSDVCSSDLFVLTDFSEMAEDERETTRKAQLALGKAVAVMIEEGIADGSVRQCKPVVTSRLLYAAFNGIARLPAGPDRPSALEMADDLLEVMFEGLVPRSSASSARARPAPDIGSTSGREGVCKDR